MRVFNGRPELEMDKPSSSHLDMDDVPIGSIVKTPSGRVGVVIKHRGAESKLDLFQRVVIKFYEPLGDSVVSQSRPNLCCRPSQQAHLPAGQRF